jgi:hypothetical protein
MGLTLANQSLNSVSTRGRGNVVSAHINLCPTCPDIAADYVLVSQVGKNALRKRFKLVALVIIGLP